MTMTTVRTYAVGDEGDEYVWDSDSRREWCQEDVGNGYVCSIARGHEGPQHVGATAERVWAVKDREQPYRAEVGDVVHCVGVPFVYVAQVLAVTDNDDELGGATAAWVVGTCVPDGRAWRLIKRRLTDWRPGANDGYTGPQPTTAHIGEAFVEKHAALQTQARATRDTLETVRRDYEALETRHDEFRVQVRDLAVEKAKELGWCTPGLNEALEQLGLERSQSDFYVTATIRVERSVRLRVTAENGTDAWQKTDAFDESELREALEAYEDDGDNIVDWSEWSLVHVNASTNTQRAD